MIRKWFVIPFALTILNFLAISFGQTSYDHLGSNEWTLLAAAENSEPIAGTGKNVDRETASHPQSDLHSPMPFPEKKRTGPRFQMIIKDGRMHLQVEGRSLSFLLEEIARKGGINIFLANDLQDLEVSEEFIDIPVEEALRELLKEFDTFVSYQAGEQGPASLTSVWVYPKGQGRNIKPVPLAIWGSTKEVERSLSAPEAAERAEAYEVLVDRQGAGALETVLQAIRDPDDLVRYRSLYKALESGVIFPLESLRHLVQYDPSADVRFLALEAIVNDSRLESNDLRGVLEIAADDSSERIRDQARQILSYLDPHS